MSSPALEYARQNQPRFLAELKDLLRIPSVSTLPQHKPDVERAAQFVADQMRRVGLEHVEVIKTPGHPLVYGDWLHAAGKPTVLCYGHYDVQPADPLDALARMIAKLKDDKGKVLIPGFYKRVKKPTTAEMKAWKRLPFNIEHYRKTEIGSKVLTGEPGYSVFEKTWSRPTLEVHGMPGGFVGAGAKTVIPARAFAKVSMRLVPDQRPQEI